MAFYENEDEKQLDPNAPQQPQTGGESAFVAGQGAAQTGQAPGGGASPDNPGNFVGIQQYLDKNKSQSGKLGDQVAGQVQSTIQGAQDDVDSLSGRFNQQADSGQIQNIQNAVNDAKNITQGAASGQAGQNLSDADKQRFGEVSNAQYQGPNQLIDTDLYAPAYNKIKTAQSYADLSKNESGNQQLLRDIYKAPSYSAGENRLDSYLLNSQDNRQKLDASRQNAGGLDQKFEAANAGAAQYAQQQKALADSVKQSAQQQLTQTQTQRNQEIQAQLDAISKDWRSEYDHYLNLLKNSNNGENLQLSPEEAAKLGVEKGQRIFNLLNPAAGNTPEQYLQMQEFDPNKVIGKDEQAQLAALDELSGTFGGANQNKYTQQDLAGTLTKEAAFQAEKFGLSADESQKLFDSAAKITNLVSEASKSATITDEQSRSVTTYVKDLLKRVGGKWWNPFVWFEEVTRAVTTILNIQVQLGNVTSKGNTSGTVESYLQGNKGGTYKDEGGMKSLDWGAALNPTYIIDQRADDKIDELDRQIKSETQQNWIAQMEQYLRNAGYYNQTKSK